MSYIIYVIRNQPNPTMLKETTLIKAESLPIGSYMRENDVPFLMMYSLTETKRYEVGGEVYIPIDELKRLYPNTMRSLQTRVSTLMVTE